MGFEVLPIEEDDIDELDPKYDIFEVTSSAKWVPRRFRTPPTEAPEEQEALAATMEVSTPVAEPEWAVDDHPEREQFPVAKINFKAEDIDEMLDKLSSGQLTGMDDFAPEDFGWPSLEPEDHEFKVLFNPTVQDRVVNLVVKPWTRFHCPSVDPKTCLLCTSPSPRDGLLSRMPSSA